MGDFSVKFNGQEVKNPALKIIIGILALFPIVIVAIVAIFAVIVVIPVVLTLVGIVLTVTFVAIAALLVPHFIMRKIGRQGFFIMDGPKGKTTLRVGISGESFKKIK